MKTSEPFKLVVGRVVGAHQGTNDYDVVTDFGRFTGVFHGATRGAGGVQEAGGLMPGTFVLAAFAEGERYCFIVMPFLPLWGVGTDDPQQHLVYPPVAGFDVGKRMSGQLYAQNIYGSQNRPSDVAHDAANGEWAMSSPFGAGAGVEMFRAWLRGGPFSGLWCHSDSQLTRLAGLDYEFLTMADSDYQRRHGNSLVRNRSRVWYPSEAVADLQPRDIEVTGAVHAGRQRFMAPAAARGVARPALFHESIDTNGALTVTSAGGIVLQRYLGVVTPEESEAPVPPAATPQLLTDQPLDADSVRNAVVTDPVPPVTPTATTQGMTWFQRALDLVTSQTSIRGRGGFDRLPIQWPDAGQPPGVPTDLTHTTYDAKMWRSAPVSVVIPLDAVEKPKTFYVGRSMVALLPDGSVLIEDASHSQILMSGGNIMFSAAHDIVMAPGRNFTVIAGNDASVRAARNIDVASNEGRVSIKAETQLSFLGGNNGADGVLIESRGGSTWKPGTGTAQSLGGILLKSSGGLYGDAASVGLRATNEVAITSAVFEVSAPTAAFRLSSGMLIYSTADGVTPSYEFTPAGAVLPATLLIKGDLAALGSAFVDGQILATDSIASGGSVVGQSVGPGGDASKRAVDTAAAAERRAINATLLSTAKAAQQINLQFLTSLNGVTPLNGATATTLGFSFPTSKQLGTDVAFSFELPETRWQAMSRRGGFGSSRVWTEKPVKSPSGDGALTAAAPGYEAWGAVGYQLDNTDLYLNITNGAVIPQTDGGEVLPDAVKVKIDGNFRIGA